MKKKYIKPATNLTKVESAAILASNSNPRIDPDNPATEDGCAKEDYGFGGIWDDEPDTDDDGWQ